MAATSICRDTTGPAILMGAAASTVTPVCTGRTPRRAPSSRAKGAAMKTLTALIAVLCAAPVLAQTPAPSVEVSGSVTPAVLGVDNDTNSSKLTEYRDVDDKLFLPGANLTITNRAAGWFLNASAVNASRDDRTIVAEGGRLGVWRVEGAWLGVPHNFSNRALTPY